jgi:hypothetical protein
MNRTPETCPARRRAVLGPVRQGQNGFGFGFDSLVGW